MNADNIRMLHDTLNICQQGFYACKDKSVKLKLSLADMKEARVFLPDEVAALAQFKAGYRAYSIGRCSYSCENIDSFSMARKRYPDPRYTNLAKNKERILVLNLANPVNPGGGVRVGARAQEEDLCRKSSLLLSLGGAAASAYYDYNRSLFTYMGSDAVIITPNVEIVKDENGNPLEESLVVAVMTCAAPCLIHGMEGLSPEQYEDMVYNRILGMLRCAAHTGYKHLVLGAFGCGAFGNDARVVSDLYYRALKDFDYGGMREKDMFRSIDFAVLSKDAAQYNYKEFYRNFGGNHFYDIEDAIARHKAFHSAKTKEVNLDKIRN